MARIKEKVKIYIYRGTYTGALSYSIFELEHCPWLVYVGTTETLIDFDEADLLDASTAQINKAEQDLEAHRAESAAKESQLLDKVESWGGDDPGHYIDAAMEK